MEVCIQAWKLALWCVDNSLAQLMTSRTSQCFCGQSPHWRTALSYNYCVLLGVGLEGGNRLTQGWDTVLEQNVEPSQSVASLQNRKLLFRGLCVNTHSLGCSFLFRNTQ